MLTLASSRRTRIEAQITAINTRITALETAVENAVSKDVESYYFNSGDGAQRAVNRKLEEMETTLDYLYRRREYLYNLLRGRGIVQMVVRRR